MEPERPRILAFGAGVQSHALLALLGQGKYPTDPPEEVWFCDPLNERPETYAFLERVTRPYCTTHGITFLTLHKTSKISGESLMESYRRRQQFPLRQNRHCTVDWKIKVMEAECKRREWHQTTGVEKHIGISMDEIHRATSTGQHNWEVARYPLVDARIYRDDCVAICRAEFGEVPIKSGCYFCKFQRRAQWREVWEARTDGRWAELVAWENEVVANHGLAAVFIPLRRKGVANHTLGEWAAIWAEGEQLAFPDMEPEGACDGGYCMV